MDSKDYVKLVKKSMPKTEHAKTMIKAFVVGGIICMIGQAIFDTIYYFFPEMTQENVVAFTLIIIITVTGMLTAFGVYDKIGAFAGAGTVIPITGFANAVVSPAIERNREGYILGVCDNMFSIAGPVIVFGISGSIIVGFLILIFRGAFSG